MATLWQKFVKLFEGAGKGRLVSNPGTGRLVQPDTTKVKTGKQVIKVINPLDVELEDHLSVNTVETESVDFKVVGIQNYFTYPTIALIPNEEMDYFIEGSDLERRLWFVPNKNVAGLGYDIVFLRKIAEFEYDKDYHVGLDYKENKGVAEEPILDADSNETKEVDTFWRVNDIKDDWKFKIKVIGAGKIGFSSMTRWDFWREFKNEAGKMEREFYLVEMDGVVNKNDKGEVVNLEGSGMFKIWRGCQIDATRVEKK